MFVVFVPFEAFLRELFETMWFAVQHRPTVTRVLGWFQKQLAVALVTSRLLRLPAVDAHLSANLINSKETVKSAAHAGDGDHSPFSK